MHSCLSLSNAQSSLHWSTDLISIDDWNKSSIPSPSLFLFQQKSLFVLNLFVNIYRNFNVKLNIREYCKTWFYHNELTWIRQDSSLPSCELLFYLYFITPKSDLISLFSMFGHPKLVPIILHGVCNPSMYIFVKSSEKLDFSLINW